jgi:hypothetical protein
LSGVRYVLEQIESVGSNLVYAEHVKTGNQASTLSDELTVSDLEAVRSIPTVVEVAGTRTAPRPSSRMGREGDADRGDGGISANPTPRDQPGRYFDPDELASGAKVTRDWHLQGRVSTFRLSEVQRDSVVVPFIPAGVSLPISGWSVAMALAVSSSAAWFGYLLARRAADLQPVDALRYE